MDFPSIHACIVARLAVAMGFEVIPTDNCMCGINGQ